MKKTLRIGLVLSYAIIYLGLFIVFGYFISLNETNYNFIDKYSIIDYAFKNKRFISIGYHKCKYCYDIKINDFDGKTIKYQIITQTGKLDKEKSLDIEKINYILIDSIELNILEKLLGTK